MKRIVHVLLLLIVTGCAFWLIPTFRILPLGLWLLCQSQPSPLPVPVQGVARKQLADTWGGMRSGGRHHQGIDIFGPRGQNIRSTTKGVITKVGEDSLGGHVVIVLGPAGYSHYYAHLDGFADIHPGQWVAKGTVLGTVGNTGNAKGTPPHLHYGIYKLSGQAINPYPLLRPDSREGSR